MNVDSSITAMCSSIQQLFNIGEEQAENLVGFLVVNLKEIAEELPEDRDMPAVRWAEIPFLARCLHAIGRNCAVTALTQCAERLHATVAEHDIDALVGIGDEIRSFLLVSGF